MPLLTSHCYGKTKVRLTQVLREGARHRLTEISVQILFHGDFAASYLDADNSAVLPTDTMKNTVYALARQHPVDTVEHFAQRLADHFLGRLDRLHAVEITIQQRPWEPIGTHASAFFLAGQDTRTTHLHAPRDARVLRSGFSGLEVLKTAHSSFFGYATDEFTTLPETEDRLLGTVLDADWTYRKLDADFDHEYQTVRFALLDTFACHRSKSVQHTLYDMASAALKASTLISDIHLVMPNKHRILADLSRFALDNPNQLFVPTDEPSGYIEARVSADSA